MSAANLSGAGTASAAEKITALLNPEREELPTGDEEPQQQEAEKSASIESEELEAEEPEQGHAEADEERYRVKVNGEELDVSLDDLKKSYMMESDYRQKTTKVSEDRRALEHMQADLDGRLTEVKSLIEFEASQLESEEMLALKEDYPAEYVAKIDALKAKADKFKSFKDESNRRLDAKRKELIQEEQEKLMTAIPDFLDEEKLSIESPKITKQLNSVGYTESELGNLSDHRIFVLARKAMLYDEINSQNPASKKIKSAPRSSAPGASTSKEARVTDEQSKQRTKLKKSGHVRDAQALIKSMLR